MNKVIYSWRDLPPTQKQLDYIVEMNEFSEWILPTFKGKTRGEASDYIDKWIKVAHEGFNEHEDAGDRI